MRNLLLIVACCLIVLVSGCNKVTVQSSWNDGRIKIDAVSKDWGPRLVWNEKNKTGLGVANDADNLYLCLTTSDRTLPRLIMMGGFIVNIDQKGAKSHNFGIKFPMGMSGQGFQPAEPPDDMEQNLGDQDQRRQNRPQQDTRGPQGMRDRGRLAQNDDQETGFMSRMNDLQTELMLLGPGKGQETIVPLENDLGLEVKIGRERQQLVYEVKIPFDLISKYMQIAQISTTKPLKINFSTAKIEMPSDAPNGGMSGGPDGGMGGMGGGRMGGPGGGMGGGPDGGMGGGPGGGMGGPGGAPGSIDSSDQSFSYNISITLAIKQ